VVLAFFLHPNNIAESRGEILKYLLLEKEGRKEEREGGRKGKGKKGGRKEGGKGGRKEREKEEGKRGGNCQKFQYKYCQELCK
jgi:hypothetical protein